MFVKILIEFLQAKRGDPDQTPRSAASDLGLHCLPMSYKKDAGLIWAHIKETKRFITSHEPS